MPNYQVQAQIWPTNNLIRDASTNTFACQATDLTTLGQFMDDLTTFYQSVRVLYPDLVRQSDHVMRAYVASAAPPRVPVISRTFDFVGAPGGAPLPTEVAMCMSFKGVPSPGVSLGSQRGRVYIGPLRQSNIGTDGRPTAGAITSLVDAGQALLDASNANANYTWAVWSPTLQDIEPIVRGHVDNEYDTQRRRGRRATSRSVFS